MSSKACAHGSCVYVDVISNCFFSCKDRASERDRPYRREKKRLKLKKIPAQRLVTNFFSCCEMNSAHILSEVCELLCMEIDSSQKQNHPKHMSMRSLKADCMFEKHKDNTNTNHKRRNANPPDMRFCHPAEKQSKKRTGPGPTKTTTPKICEGHSGEKPLCRISQKDVQTNWLLSRKVKHA